MFAVVVTGVVVAADAGPATAAIGAATAATARVPRMSFFMVCPSVVVALPSAFPSCTDETPQMGPDDACRGETSTTLALGSRAPLALAPAAPRCRIHPSDREVELRDVH